MKSIINDSDPKTSCSTDSIGKTSISEFMNLPNELESVNFIFHMIDVVRKKDGNFKDILSSMIN